MHSVLLCFVLLFLQSHTGRFIRSSRLGPAQHKCTCMYVMTRIGWLTVLSSLVSEGFLVGNRCE